MGAARLELPPRQGADAAELEGVHEQLRRLRPARVRRWPLGPGQTRTRAGAAQVSKRVLRSCM